MRCARSGMAEVVVLSVRVSEQGADRCPEFGVWCPDRDTEAGFGLLGWDRLRERLCVSDSGRSMSRVQALQSLRPAGGNGLSEEVPYFRTVPASDSSCVPISTRLTLKTRESPVLERAGLFLFSRLRPAAGKRSLKTRRTEGGPCKPSFGLSGRRPGNRPVVNNDNTPPPHASPMESRRVPQ
jgi:hypothetical protein